MEFRVLYHQTIIFTGKMVVFISDGQCVLWSQNVCRKYSFQRSAKPNFKNFLLGAHYGSTSRDTDSASSKETQSLKENGWRQNCLNFIMSEYLKMLFIFSELLILIFYDQIEVLYVLRSDFWNSEGYLTKLSGFWSSFYMQIFWLGFFSQQTFVKSSSDFIAEERKWWSCFEKSISNKSGNLTPKVPSTYYKLLWVS